MGPDGFRYVAGYLDRPRQEELVGHLRAILAAAPLFIPAMPRTGKPLSVRMSNCGPLGWVTDKAEGYRYQARHPETGRPWPPIPAMLLELWHDHVLKQTSLMPLCFLTIFQMSS